MSRWSKSLPTLTAEHLTALMGKAGVSDRELARYLGIRDYTVRWYREGTLAVPYVRAKRILAVIKEICDPVDKKDLTHTKDT